MKILGIDTSTNFLTLALTIRKKTIFRYKRNLGRRHSAALLKVLDRLFKQNGIKPADIDLLCVGLGPGSFTGLRISLSTVKAFALALKVPALGVSSMDVIAKNVACEGRISVILDAKRGNVYTSTYENRNYNLKVKTAPCLININDWLKSVNKRTFVLGDGLGIYADMLAGVKNIVVLDSRLWYPDAVNLAGLAYDKFINQGADNIVRLQPLYLYPKECQIKNK